MESAMDEDALLAEMLALAERLCTSEDALMAGQYAHLKARIEALVVLREPARAV
jgi:hypothetical protein